MSRVKDGTSMLGFTCDSDGCYAKATSSPVICVPWEGEPIMVKKPIIAFKDLHFCLAHQNSASMDDLLSKPMRDLIEGIAESHNGRPDFARAFVHLIRVHSWEYQQFLEKNGLVQPGDATPATASADVWLPNVE